MEFLKFNKVFIDNLILQSTDIVTLDNVLQGHLKNYLFNRRSFALEPTELEEVKANIETTYNYFLQTILPEYQEVARLSGTKTRLHTRDLTQNYGNEKVENNFFEPVENNTQAEVKQNAQNTTWQPDVTQETIEEEEYNDNATLKQFYNDIFFKIPMFFSRYVNNLMFGGD